MNLCTWWMFVFVFPSKAALFDCSESHFLAMWMLVFILFEFGWEIFRFFPSANYDWIFLIKYRWWITDGCILELWEAALRTDSGTHKLISSKQKRRTCTKHLSYLRIFLLASVQNRQKYCKWAEVLHSHHDVSVGFGSISHLSPALQFCLYQL